MQNFDQRLSWLTSKEVDRVLKFGIYFMNLIDIENYL